MKVFRRTLFLMLALCLCINLLCLFIAVIAPLINPKFFWPPALFGLFFKVFFGAHCIFTLVYLFIRRSRNILIALIAGFVISIPSVFANFGFRFVEKDYTREETVRIMSYNSTSFGWFKSPDYDSILANIRQADPDILCLQEYYKHTKKHKKKILQFLTQEMGYKHYYEYTTNIIQRSKNHVGQAYFSRYPLHNFTPIPFQEKSSNGASFVDIYLPNDTFRVINVHFQSIRLSEKEYDLTKIKPLEEEKDKKELKIYQIMQKFRAAFRRRAYQASLLDSVIEASPYKVIVCGDFNDTPNSYLYRTLSNTLSDSYLRTNWGVGSTFAGKLPGLRIDYMLTDPEIEVARTFVLKNPGGQHYPLVSDIFLR